MTLQWETFVHRVQTQVPIILDQRRIPTRKVIFPKLIDIPIWNSLETNSTAGANTAEPHATTDSDLLSQWRVMWK